jgi:hypothetical protein
LVGKAGGWRGEADAWGRAGRGGVTGDDSGEGAARDIELDDVAWEPWRASERVRSALGDMTDESTM